MALANITATNATGDLLPCIKSDIKPSAILPNIAPKSITVERFAT